MSGMSFKPQQGMIADTKRFVKHRGHVNSRVLKQIDRALAIVFGLDEK